MCIRDRFKTAEAEGKEKHVPVIEVKKCAEYGEDTVNVVVPHPNTVEHHIKWIQLFGLKDAGQVVHIATFDLGPTFGVPEVSAHAKTEGLKSLYALSYGLWESSVELG